MLQLNKKPSNTDDEEDIDYDHPTQKLKTELKKKFCSTSYMKWQWAVLEALRITVTRDISYRLRFPMWELIGGVSNEHDSRYHKITKHAEALLKRLWCKGDETVSLAPCKELQGIFRKHDVPLTELQGTPHHTLMHRHTSYSCESVCLTKLNPYDFFQGSLTSM